MDIRLLIMLLFQIYGKISANNLREKYDNVATMLYNIDEPSMLFLTPLMTSGRLRSYPTDHTSIINWWI